MKPVLFALLLLPLSALAQPVQDPLNSVMWDFHHKGLLGGAPVVFDERVRLVAPPFAEDSRQVPIQIDATGLGEEVVRILAWADLNPIPRVLDFQPLSDQVQPFVSVRIRVEQATAVRAAALTRDGTWHVGSAKVDAAGGGCTAPSVVRAQPGWEDRLGEVLGGRFPRGDFSRLRLEVSHPMDNGLIDGIPEFYLEKAELRAADGTPLARLDLFPAIGENPNFGFEVKGHAGTRLWLRDNNGNEFEAEL